jgi:hypothetical protein
MQDDFNGFLWNVVMLAMGGSALGGLRCSRVQQWPFVFVACVQQNWCMLVNSLQSLLPAAGEAVKSSGLLETIAIGIKELVGDQLCEALFSCAGD